MANTGSGTRPDYVAQCEESDWRGDMCLLEFLRKSNNIGLRVRLARKMDKVHDYVHSMSATVEAYDAGSAAGCEDGDRSGLVRLPRHGAGAVERQRSQRQGCVYPLRAGYADTVHRYQGAEPEHVTFWPDRSCGLCGTLAREARQGLPAWWVR